MCHQNLADIPDDPYRVAPPWCAPGEVDPGDAPQVSDKEAAARVLAALQGRTDVAFGLSGHEWDELLVDYIALTKSHLALLDWQNLHDIRRDMEIFIGNQANNLLAEMDADALEREGFPV